MTAPAWAEQDYAEFTRWWRAKGYPDGGAAGFSDARDAFGSGMRAAREADRAARLHLAGERDEARSDFSRLRRTLLEGGQSDAAARKRCLAIIATAGTPPVDPVQPGDTQ